MNWFYAQNGQQAGPVADEELAHLVRTGVINPATLVWHSGLASWQPYAQISAATPALAGVGGPVPGAAVSGGRTVCSQCGGVFPTDEVVRVANYDVCARCKPVLLQKLQQGVAGAGVFGVQATTYAGFWIRLAAAILDGVILFIPNMLLSILFNGVLGGSMGGNMYNPQTSQFDTNALFWLGMYYLTVGTLGAVYNGVCMSRFGGLPGMLVCGLRVIRPDGRPLSFWRGLARYFANLLNYFTFWLAYLLVAFDEQKRGLHDFICDTRVVYK